MRYGCDPVSLELLDLWRKCDDETVFTMTGQSLLDATPVGVFARPFSHLATQASRKVADVMLGATPAVFEAVATLHARYYRQVLFPNLVESAANHA